MGGICQKICPCFGQTANEEPILEEHMLLNKGLFDTCNKKILQISQKPYHWDSQKEFKKLKYRDEETLSLWRMCEENGDKNPSLQSANIRDIMNVILQSQVFSARVIYVFEKTQQNIQLNSQLKKLYHELKNKSKVYNSYKRLNKIDQEYGDRYLEDIGMIKINNSNYHYYYQKGKEQKQSGGQSQDRKSKHWKPKNIVQLHQRQGDYTYLEEKHDYIQHMFPNHYRSNFNSSAQPLGFLQAQKFRQSKVIGLRLLQSVCIFFDFLGIKISQKNFTLEVQQNNRFRNALFKNTHNHLRLRRILACLSVTGFRPIALNLINSLKKLQSSMQWKKYGEQEYYQEALGLCFNPEQKFPYPHIILKEIFPDFFRTVSTFSGQNNQKKELVLQNCQISSSRGEDQQSPEALKPDNKNEIQKGLI